MVNGPASRFSWAFNDVSFSDVQLVLRANKAHVDGCTTHGSSLSSYDCQPGIGLDQRNTTDKTARRGCERTSTPVTSCQGDAKNVYHCHRGVCHGGKAAWHPRPQTTEIRIHAHSIILASCSEMMRSWLSRWSEEHADDDGDVADIDGPSFKQRDRRRRRLALRLEVDLAPEELAAGEAVVRFMYTQSLDGVEDDEELLHCMLLADRWLLPDCVAACAARLQSTPAGSLCWRVRAALLALPAGLSAASPHVAQLQARAEASLMRTFRCPEMILEDPDNRLLLLSLPPDRLEQLLLGRQDLQVTSENVVLALLSAWLHHNYDHLEAEADRGCGLGSSGSCGLSCGSSCGSAPGQHPQHPQQQDPPSCCCTHHHDGHLGIADNTGGGGAGSGGGGEGPPPVAHTGPPEVEALVQLVRYGDLTPHYRTAVAPSLPVLRGLRLHHHLLAKASALYGGSPPATTCCPPATRPSAPPPRQSSIESSPTPPAQPPEPTKGVLPAAAAAAAAGSGSGTTALSRSGSLAEEYSRAEPGGAADKATTSGKGGEGKGTAACRGPAAATVAMAAAGCCGGGGAESSLSRSSSDAASEKQRLMEMEMEGAAARVGTGLLAKGEAMEAACGGSSGSQAAAAAAAAEAATGLTAAAVVVLQSAQPVADLAAAAAAVAEPGAALLRLPRRLSYSSFRRIEWSRDIRDVRLHLTGVGGPMVGGEAAAGLQLSPPVFLGGYNWHVATRFVPASAVAAPGAAAAAPTYAAATAAVTATAAGLSPAAGRLQLQLGVVCTAPGADSATAVPSLLDIQRQQLLLLLQQEPSTASGTAGSSCPAVDGDASAGGAAGTRGFEGWSPLEIANCTLGVMDAAGRTAWQAVQAPCMLQPGRGGNASSSGSGISSGSGSVSSGSGSSCGTFDGGVTQGRGGRGSGAGAGRWEFWRGLSGLEPTWWESGSALTAGGVLRLHCSLTLQT